MKRTDTFTKIISLLLFLAFAAYLGVYLYRSGTDKTVTAEALTTTVSIGGVASGIVIRQEAVLESSEPYIDVITPDGTRVAVGQTVARAMSSETGLERANRMHELELEISRVEAALGGLGDADDLSKRDESLKNAVMNLTSAVARHDLDSVDNDALSLRTLLFDNSSAAATQQDLDTLKAELFSLQNSSSGDTSDLKGEKGGVFTSVVDGYEHLGPDSLKALTPEALRSLIDSGEETEPGAYGKLVTDFKWYFAAVMEEQHLANLSVGKTVTLNFGRYFSEDIRAKVYSVSGASDGEVAVTFVCDTALADTLSIREAAALVTFEEYSGIRIPTQAIRTDEKTESTYVWVISAMKLERKKIEILYAEEGYAVVRREAAASSLREGNTVVVSGTELYEGKMMT